jgi:methylmalonyl-CoA/ethylmalonyl-CoA epimerase
LGHRIISFSCNWGGQTAGLSTRRKWGCWEMSAVGPDIEYTRVDFMVIDHIGIVVRSLEHGIQRWEKLFGYTQNSEIVINTRQKVRVVFLSKKGSLTVKLLEPSEQSSAVSQFAQKGGGLHHLCFRCKDLELQIPVLKENGARLIVPPEPGEAFRNHDIAFLLAANLNIELIDTTEKEGWVEPV